MKPTAIIIIVILLVSICVEIAMAVLGRKYMKQLAECLYEGNYGQFDALSVKKIVQWTVPPYNFHYLRLNRYLMENDNANVRKVFDMFKNVKLNKPQKQEILTKAFQYYINQNDKENSQYYLNEIESSDIDEQIKVSFSRLYKVFMENETELLDVLLEETEKLEDKYKGTNEYMISRIYQNLGNKELASRYQKKAEEHTKLFTESVN